MAIVLSALLTIAQASGTGNPEKGDPSIWGSAPVVIGFIVLGLAIAAFLVWFVLRGGETSSADEAGSEADGPGTAPT